MNVIFLVFNRPDLTARVFARIAEARPSRLFVVADGPRSAEEEVKCRAVRDITERVDWPCRVERNYSDVNLGCRRRVSSGLDWAFSRVEDAIVLEDDCLPHAMFFPFCEELLQRYSTDERVGYITGDCFVKGLVNDATSYYFSIYGGIWGWASWRRAWRHYDVHMTSWPENRRAARHSAAFPSIKESRYFETVWDATYAGSIDTWDYQWTYACRMHGLLVVAPRVNLVSNIGFRIDAARTRDACDPLARLPVQSIELPLRHPLSVCPDRVADRQHARRVYLRRPPGPPQWLRALGNRHLYGRLVRRVPWLGRWWTQWRGRHVGYVSGRSNGMPGVMA